MKLVDANVLLYSVNQSARQHTAARDWLSAALVRTEAVALPWVCLLAFLRLSTSSRIFDRPLTIGDAFDAVDGWLAAPAAVPVHPGPRHAAVLRSLLAGAGTAGNLTTDAHLAALAVENDAEVVTFDRDFGRFDVRHLLLRAT